MASDEQTHEAGEAAPETPETGRDGMSYDELQTALADAETKVAQLKDQTLRAQAEMDNVRKRAQRDVENAHKFALERFAADLLPVVDNFERAVESARERAEDPAAAAIAEGVELSLKLFLDTLKRAGIEPLDPLGEPFDPQFHQAVSTIESPHSEPGTVVTVLQKGYLLNGRLLRAAMAIVARAPQQAAPEA